MPEGVVGLTVSQVVASQRAAVRMECNLDLAKVSANSLILFVFPVVRLYSVD